MVGNIFARGLAKINTPHDWIGNDQRKAVMQQYKTRVDDGPIEDEDQNVEDIRFLPSCPPRVLKTPEMRFMRRKVSASPLARSTWQTL